MPGTTPTDRLGTPVPTSTLNGSDLLTKLLAMANAQDNANIVRSFGKSIIMGSGTRTDAAYGALDNGPDQVPVTLESGGLIVVRAQAVWRSSTSGAGRAAVFVGGNQAKIANVASSNAPVVSEVASLNTTDAPLVTTPTGLVTADSSSVGGYGADVTTGQIVGIPSGGGDLVMAADAGTYTVSLQWKSATGSVTARARHVWVWTLF